jgi:hypothetical protein
MKIHNPNCEGVKNPSLDHVSNMLIDRCPNLEVRHNADRIFFHLVLLLKLDLGRHLQRRTGSPEG